MSSQGPTSGGSQIGQLDMNPAQSDANSVNVPFFGQPQQPDLRKNTMHPDFLHMLTGVLGQFGENLKKQQAQQQAQQAQFQQYQHQAAMNSLQSNPLGQGLHTLFSKLFGPKAGGQFQPTTGPMPSDGDSGGGDDGQ